MQIVSIHDREELESFFLTDPVLHVYSLGDLDPVWWHSTSWYGYREGGALREVILLFLGLSVPTVQAFATHDPTATGRLLGALAPVLPARFHAHLGPPELLEVAGKRWAFSAYGLTHRMRLEGPEGLEIPELPGTSTLGAEDAEEVRDFLDAAYPGNFFEPEMMATGLYMGIRQAGRLVSVAGLHVRSARYRCAALGNIATSPALRGQGLSRALTATLCRRLLDQGIVHIGLNVREANAPARALYEGLGFATHARYHEGMATLER